MITILIPQILRKFTDNKESIELCCFNINSLFDNLISLYPLLNSRLINEHGEINNFINIYINDEDIRFLNGSETLLKDNDIITIIPAMSGG